jgi:hypothetical protein
MEIMHFKCINIGSGSPVQNECGEGSGIYCPLGSANPVAVPNGYYGDQSGIPNQDMTWGDNQPLRNFNDILHGYSFTRVIQCSAVQDSMYLYPQCPSITVGPDAFL